MSIMFLAEEIKKEPSTNRRLFFVTNNLLERGDYAVIFKRGVQSSTRAQKSQVSARYTNYFRMDLPAYTAISPNSSSILMS